jgi:phosphoribosylanthranilate isomerase
LIQLHGDESPEFCQQWGNRVVRAIRLASDHDLQQITDYTFARMILVDAAVKGVYGGTGTVADWQLAARAKEFGLPVILAGGLTPDNVSEAIQAVDPFGVDVAGGVESAPGIKDPEKIRRFMRGVRNAFNRRRDG